MAGKGTEAARVYLGLHLDSKPIQSQMTAMQGKLKNSFSGIEENLKITKVIDQVKVEKDLYRTEEAISSIKTKIAELKRNVETYSAWKDKILDLKERGVYRGDISGAIESANTKIREGSAEIERYKMRLSELEGKKDSIFQMLANTAAQASSGIKQLGDEAQKNAPKLQELETNSKNLSDSFKGGLKNTLKYAFGISSAFVLMNRARAYITEGIEGLAEYDAETADTINRLKSSLSGLKGALATAFAPILNTVGPILTQFIDWLSDAINSVSMFFAILSGKDYFMKASKSASSAADEIGGVGEAAKEALRYLAPFDEINAMPSNDNSGSGGSSGSSGSGLSFEKTTLEDVPKWIEDVEKFWDRLKDIVFEDTSEGVNYLDFSGISLILPNDEQIDNYKKQWEKFKEKLEYWFEGEKANISVAANMSVVVPENTLEKVRDWIRTKLDGLKVDAPVTVAFPEPKVETESIVSVVDSKIRDVFSNISTDEDEIVGADQFKQPVYNGNIWELIFGKPEEWSFETWFTTAVASGLAGTSVIAAIESALAGVGATGAFGFTASVTDVDLKTLDSSKRVIKEMTGDITKTKTDALSDSQKTLGSFTAKLASWKDEMSSKVVTFQAKLTSWSDGLKSKCIEGFAAAVSSWSDKIDAAKKWISGFGATVASWYNGLKKDKYGVYGWFSSFGATVATWYNGLTKDKYGVYGWFSSFGATVASWYNGLKKDKYGVYGWFSSFGATVATWYNGLKKDKYGVYGWFSSFGATITQWWNSLTGKTVSFKADGGVFSNGKWSPIQQYASGGMPGGGQLFVAREAGPELVGTLGGHTAVMNNDQIVASVSAGVARAIAGIKFYSRERSTPHLAVIGASLGRSEEHLSQLAQRAAETAAAGGTAQVIELLKQILAALQDMDRDVYLDGKSVKDRIVELINRNTRATGVCEIMV